MRRLALTAAVLAGAIGGVIAQRPACAAPEALRVGEECLLLADGPGRGVQGSPSAAFGRGVYLAAWREGWHGVGGRSRIYTARISPAGKVLDAAGIEVAPCDRGVQERPRVAFAGGVFLVVWQDLRNGRDYDVLAARVSVEGKVLDREPIAVAVAPRTQALPEVASDGRGFLVVWQGLRGEETAYRGFAVPIAADGRIGKVVETGATPQPKIAWGGECYLAAYGPNGVVTVLLDRQGKPINPSKWGHRVIRQHRPVAFSLSAAGGKGWLVVAHRSRPDPWGWGGPGAIRAGFVGPDGKLVNQDAVKEPAGVRRKLSCWLDIGRDKKPGATWPWGPTASVWTGKHSLVVWQRHHLCGEKMTHFVNCDLIAARVAGSRPLDEAGAALAASGAEERSPALAGDGAGRALCVYEKQRNGVSRVAARMLISP
jgi:hypothetical protein